MDLLCQLKFLNLKNKQLWFFCGWSQDCLFSEDSYIEFTHKHLLIQMNLVTEFQLMREFLTKISDWQSKKRGGLGLVLC